MAIIKKVQLPGDSTIYDIYDASAIHSKTELDLKPEDLGLSAAMVLKGTKATVTELPATGNKVGDVWYVTADDCEYVWTENEAWEPLGPAHDYVSNGEFDGHKHTVSITGSNQASTVTGTVTVPTVSKTQKYLTGSANAPVVTPSSDSVLGANTQFTVFGGTASTSKMVTTTVKNPSVSDVSIPNVTGNSSVTASKVSSTTGTAASWSASVSNGVLSFNWTANTPTSVSATDVTATNTTLGTALSASKVTTSNVTVATGALASNGAGSTVATGVSTISVSASGDTVDALTGVTVGAPTITLTEADTTSTGAVPVVSAVSIGSTSASLTNGSAAAQKWSQTSAPATTSTPT